MSMYPNLSDFFIFQTNGNDYRWQILKCVKLHPGSIIDELQLWITVERVSFFFFCHLRYSWWLAPLHTSCSRLFFFFVVLVFCLFLKCYCYSTHLQTLLLLMSKVTCQQVRLCLQAFHDHRHYFFGLLVTTGRGFPVHCWHQPTHLLVPFHLCCNVFFKVRASKLWNSVNHRLNLSRWV